jgi:hypothetical protein
MRDTSYATELARAVIDFESGSEGRIERLLFKEDSQEGIRFSWWREKRMIPRPLDLTEEELLALFRNALQKGVFSEDFLLKLRAMLYSR